MLTICKKLDYTINTTPLAFQPVPSLYMGFCISQTALMQLALYGSLGATPQSGAAAVVLEAQKSAAILGVAYTSGYYKMRNLRRQFL
jgi:hypothetical protein